MKATGMVRRIDDLGRVVVPKEIRRTMRIREGDPLEIFTDRDGEIILKKYSPIGELGDFALEYAESLAKTSGHIVCISDRDSIIAVAGGSKKELLEKPVSQELERLMEDRSSHTTDKSKDKVIPVINEDNSETQYTSQSIATIVSEGDPIGAVIMLSKDSKVTMGEVESKLAQSAADFLGRHME